MIFITRWTEIAACYTFYIGQTILNILRLVGKATSRISTNLSKYDGSGLAGGGMGALSSISRMGGREYFLCNLY